jgi:hypothetical protein
VKTGDNDSGFFSHYQSLIIVMTIDLSIVNNASQTGKRVTVFHWPAKVWYPCLYQLAAILSQKYQAFPAVVAFNQGLPIFHFLLKRF